MTFNGHFDNRVSGHQTTTLIKCEAFTGGETEHADIARKADRPAMHARAISLGRILDNKNMRRYRPQQTAQRIDGRQVPAEMRRHNSQRIRIDDARHHAHIHIEAGRHRVAQIDGQTGFQSRMRDQGTGKSRQHNFAPDRQMFEIVKGNHQSRRPRTGQRDTISRKT